MMLRLLVQQERHSAYTYMKSFVIVCEPLARALNSTPIKSTDVGYFHSISFPLNQIKCHTVGEHAIALLSASELKAN